MLQHALSMIIRPFPGNKTENGNGDDVPIVGTDQRLTFTCYSLPYSITSDGRHIVSWVATTCADTIITVPNKPAPPM